MAISNPVSIGTNTGTGVNAVAITVGAGGVPAGALIVVGVSDSSTANTLCNCTDTAGNTYTKFAGFLNNAMGIMAVYYAFNATALVNGNTITATLGQTGKNAAISAFYCTGVQTSSDPRDANATGTSSTSTTPSVGPTGTPVSGGELFVGFVATDGTSADTFTQDSTNAAYTNFPVRAGIAGAGGPTIAGGAFIQSTAAALTYAPTLGTSRDWATKLWSFKPVANNGAFFAFFQ
jgi:hypothetical protein